eukprot:2946570-Prymnesium_polylepis.1
MHQCTNAAVKRCISAALQQCSSAAVHCWCGGARGGRGGHLRLRWQRVRTRQRGGDADADADGARPEHALGRREGAVPARRDRAAVGAGGRRAHGASAHVYCVRVCRVCACVMWRGARAAAWGGGVRRAHQKRRSEPSSEMQMSKKSIGHDDDTIAERNVHPIRPAHLTIRSGTRHET